MTGSEATTFRRLSDDIVRTLKPPGAVYYCTLAVLLAVLAFGVYAFYYQVQTGLGVAGYQHPVQWGVYITNFVFWIGITHSGTLISAVLFLFRAPWRTGVARASEAMTVFAIMIGGLFPIVHLGRPYFFYWLMPYINERQLYVNFRSPLIWDFVAILTYLTVSVTFLYIGLIPDMAELRHRVPGWRRRVYKILSLGWVGSDRQWFHYMSLYGFLAAIAIPLAVSVHSIVSWDFATAITPGWHSTIFAPYFVSGAIFSGVAMMITLLIPLKTVFGLDAYMTRLHFENLGKLLLTMSLIMGYAYGMEFFTAWYSGNIFERDTFLDRVIGQYGPFTWVMFACNVFIPLLLFSRRIRTHLGALLSIAVAALIGMWLERYVIVVSSLSRGFDPAAWGELYQPTWVEASMTAASFAGFFLLFLVFIKVFPCISISELKEGATEHTEPDDMTGVPERV